MLVDLVQVITRDGLRLDGMLQTPAADVAPALPVAAVCCIHGTGGNFYSSSLFDAAARHFLGLGCAVLRINTRGHDGISTAVTLHGGRRQGAAYELVDDCRHDLAAWLELLRQRGYPRIALLGHSAGALKAIYATAHEPQLAPACVVALSPPRLSYSWFCSGPHRQTFLDDYHRAEQLVASGQPAALLEVTIPLPMAIAAASYVEKYGPDERYHFLIFVRSVPYPLLVTLGEIEMQHSLAFQGSAEALQQPPRPVTVEVIAGADHFYAGVREALLERVTTWLRTLPL